MDPNGPACPHCGSTATSTRGASGATGRALLGGGVLDSLGMVSHDLRIRFTCQDCGESFVAEDAQWDATELAEPCSITVIRERAMLGGAMPLFVHLNGQEVGSVKNGGTLEFETSVRSNSLVVTDHDRAAVKHGGDVMFEAESGGALTFRTRAGKFIQG